MKQHIYPTLGKFSDRRDVRPRILADAGGGPWWRGWGKPVRRRGRTKTSEKVRGVAGVKDSEGFGRAVVGGGEANEFGSDGMSFGVVLVKGRETRDKKVKVRAKRVFDVKVVNDY